MPVPSASCPRSGLPKLVLLATNPSLYFVSWNRPLICLFILGVFHYTCLQEFALPWLVIIGLAFLIMWLEFSCFPLFFHFLHIYSLALPLHYPFPMHKIYFWGKVIEIKKSKLRESIVLQSFTSCSYFSLTPNGHWDFCCHEQTKFNCRTMRAGWAWPKAWSNSCSFLCVSGDSCHIMGCLLLAHLLRAGRHLKLSVEEFISSSIQLVQLSLAALSYSTFILWTSYCLHPFS